MKKWFVGISVIVLIWVLIAQVYAGGPPRHHARHTEYINCRVIPVQPCPPPILYRPMLAPPPPGNPLCVLIKGILSCPFRIVGAVGDAIFGPPVYR